MLAELLRGASLFRIFLVALLAGAVTGCASSRSPTPTPIALIGTLDTSKPGIDIFVADAAGNLKCAAHSASGKLPEAISLPLSCEDSQTGTLNLTKSPDLHGTVTFANGTVGDVTFDLSQPVPPPRVAVAPPPFAVPAPVYIPTHPSYSRSYYSTGYVRPHYRRATYVHSYYRRNGTYVSGHSRRGSYVHGYYRHRR
jgi:hypothetical protein